MNRKNQVSTLLSKARAAERKGNFASSFFNLGAALALSDQLDEAAEAYRKAIRIAPHAAAIRRCRNGRSRSTGTIRSRESSDVRCYVPVLGSESWRELRSCRSYRLNRSGKRMRKD